MTTHTIKLDYATIRLIKEVIAELKILNRKKTPPPIKKGQGS